VIVIEDDPALEVAEASVHALRRHKESVDFD